MGRVAHSRIAAALVLALAAPAVLGGATGRLTSLDERLLAAHNRERAGAGLPAMRWDPALAEQARGWGEELAELNDIEHSPDDPEDPDPQGENLWLGSKGHFAPEAMVGMWIEESATSVPAPSRMSRRPATSTMSATIPS
jgi:hypothetical protein